jgi:hypothetical protein
MSLPAVLAGAQGFLGFMGALSQGKAAKDAANFNAANAREQARTDRETARIASEDKMREHRRRVSAYRAAIGSSGIEMTGTPLDVLADSSEEMALDVRRISYEGDVKGREGVVRSSILIAEGKNASKQSKISAFSSLLSAGNKYYAGQA